MGKLVRIAGRSSPAAGVAVELAGLEITQAVQNLAHSIPLIVGKATVVRAYLKPKGLQQSLRVRGEILVSRGALLPGSYIPSIGGVTLEAQGHPTLAQQRRSAAASLNFVVPPGLIGSAGPLWVRLHRVTTMDGRDLKLENNAAAAAGLVDAPPLRVHCIGLRYQLNGTVYTPRAIDFDYLRSFLRRAYPVASVSWSQITVTPNPPLEPPFWDRDFDGDPDDDPRWNQALAVAWAQLASLRNEDIKSGTDPRTHYYGLVSDLGEFLRGAATDVPDRPRPDIVAVGPAGSPRSDRLRWHDDASYADWYGAHELAHTFGRRHPGYCDNQQSYDPGYPHKDGRISEAREDCIGFDTGDASLGVPMRVLSHEDWYDVMTYCDYVWLSAYTYEGVLERLRAEDKQFAPGALEAIG